MASNGDNSKGRGVFRDKEKPTEVRLSNITAAKGMLTHLIQQAQQFVYLQVSFYFLCASAVADAIRTSLGPRGMDKMVSNNYTTSTL